MKLGSLPAPFPIEHRWSFSQFSKNHNSQSPRSRHQSTTSIYEEERDNILEYRLRYLVEAPGDALSSDTSVANDGLEEALRKVKTIGTAARATVSDDGRV